MSILLELYKKDLVLVLWKISFFFLFVAKSSKSCYLVAVNQIKYYLAFKISFCVELSIIAVCILWKTLPDAVGMSSGKNAKFTIMTVEHGKKLPDFAKLQNVLPR